MTRIYILRFLTFYHWGLYSYTDKNVRFYGIEVTKLLKGVELCLFCSYFHFSKLVKNNISFLFY